MTGYKRALLVSCHLSAMAARCDQSSHENRYHLHHKRIKDLFFFTPGRGVKRRSVTITPGIQPVVTVWRRTAWIGILSDACLTATLQLPASRVKTSDRKSVLPLDANVGHTCFVCSHSYILNNLLTSLFTARRQWFTGVLSSVFCMSFSTYQQVRVMKSRHNPQLLLHLFFCLLWGFIAFYAVSGAVV